MKSREQIAIEALPRFTLSNVADEAGDMALHLEGEYLQREDVLAMFEQATPPAKGSIDADGLPQLFAAIAEVVEQNRANGMFTSLSDSIKSLQILADRAARQSAAPGERDNCKLCLGAKGGVPGNENVVGGVVVCDYCTSQLLDMKKAGWFAAPAPSEPVPQGVPEALSVMLWLYRRLPRTYERPSFVESAITALAKGTGVDVASCMAERGAAPTATSGGEAVTQEVIDHCWHMYQQGQISADHTAKQVFAQTLSSFAKWLTPPPLPATDAASLQGVPDRLQEAQANFSAGAAAAQVVPIIGVAAAAPTATDAEGVRKAMNVAAKMGKVLYNLAQRQGYVLTDADCEMYSNLRKEWDAIRALISKEDGNAN